MPPAPRLRAVCLAVLLAPLAGAGCASSQPAEPPPAAQAPGPETSGPAGTSGPEAGEPLRLALGASAERGGHTVRFAEVVEDSRCPVGVQCVTAGRARVRVELDGEPVVLSVPHARMAPGEASAAERGGLRVAVTGLEPAPGAGDGGPVALLVTEPAED